MQPPDIVDSHCHLDFPDFAEERAAVVARAVAAGVSHMVTISTRVRRFDQVLAIAEEFDNVFCSVGTHPHNAAEELDVTADDLVRLSSHPKVVAIGEAGLEDRRGKRKRNQVPRTELEAAQIEIEQLKHKLYLAEMERDLLKKLEEIVRRDAYRR